MTHTMINALFQFHDNVDSNPSIYCETIKQQVQRQKEMLKLYEFDEDIPNRICRWIEKWCILTDGERAGEKVTLTLTQKWIIYSIFGFWGDIETREFDEQGNDLGLVKKRVRIVNDVLLVIASGNAKTTLLAWLNAYMLTHDVIPKCNIYIGSNAYRQSRLCFDTTCEILHKNKALEKCFKFTESVGEIKEKTTNALMRAMSSTGDNQEGIIPALIEVDEVHAMANSDYCDNLRKSTKRSDMLYVEMTTQGTVRGGHLDNRIDYARKVLKGETEDKNYRFCPFIFEQDSEQEIYDAFRGKLPLSVLRKSNPNLGVAVSTELLVEKIRDAIEQPSKKGTILTKNFNIPQNSSSCFYSNIECQTKEFNEDILFNAPVFVGLDMAYTRSPENDLTALSLLMFNPLTDECYFKDIAFIPKYWNKTNRSDDGKVYQSQENMIRYKSQHDSFIPYNERTKRYGYYEYANHGDVVILDEELRDEMVAEFGDVARFDLTGVTEDFMIYYIAHLQLKYNFMILKFGTDPNKASKIMNYASNSIASLDGRNPVVQFKIENRTHSEPVILKSKETRARELVYCNSKLTELHFANVTAHENTNGAIIFDRKYKTKKDLVISELSALSACNVFLNNQFTGENNTANLITWWKENGDRIKSLQ